METVKIKYLCSFGNTIALEFKGRQAEMIQERLADIRSNFRNEALIDYYSYLYEVGEFKLYINERLTLQDTDISKASLVELVISYVDYMNNKGVKEKWLG